MYLEFSIQIYPTKLVLKRFNVQDQEYASAMFDVFDKDGSGSLDINEFMHTKSVHDKSSPKDKVVISHVLYLLRAEVWSDRSLCQ